MSNPWLYRLAGFASGLGGLLGATAHALYVDPPVDPAQLAQYVKYSQPLHLVLFAAGLLVLLGWFGQFAFQSSSSGFVGLLAFLFLFLGILFGDLLRCVLEFSMIPLLIARVPYATPNLAEATYHSTPFAVLENVGKFSILVGAPLAAISLVRTRMLPGWSAVPFAITGVLTIAALVPATARMADTHFVTALYFSMTILGLAVLRASYK